MLLLLFSLVAFLLSMKFLMLNYVLMLELDFIFLNSNSIILTFLFDWMSLLFMSFVLFISSMVIFYSKEYMGEKNIERFIMMVFLFVLSMMMMIISPNLISILLGWDGLGLVSYCLVIFYQNVKSNNAGMLTVLSNRVGDVALLMVIAWMMNYGSWNFYYYMDFMKEDYSMKFIMYFVILAAMTKSAQIPFSSWLPAAMAAPTPVSSLVHSSTLVTAGIYLLIRFNKCLDFEMMVLLLFISSMTMFMAGLSANYEYDLKKIIALSTLSQLGLMISILSLGEYNLSFFHLLTHALFKATLFMCAGSMIHSFMGCQDIRFMGSLINCMPLTSCIFIISNLSLCGMPFLSGFYSKDLILEIVSMNYLNLYIYLIYFISTGLTVSYTFRLIYYLMIGDMNFYSLMMLKDSSMVMMKSMLGLIFLIIMGGSILMWMMLMIPYYICLSIFMKLMTLMVVLMGAYLGYEISLFFLNYKLKLLMSKKFSLYFSLMWNMPIVSTLGIINYFLILSKINYDKLDQGWFEFYGSQKLYKNLSLFSFLMQILYKNNYKIYLILMIYWMIFMLVCLNSLISA
uniref:NADH-ubiquinone oxidoreductase chain 5 n=1 Tax=Pselaphinae sp. 7 EF-2015 TaxID=1756861 RepID=A0A0S2M8T0_9COLE|nr:NADH deshydrogenase subunit 5 [Pselaphinae sp. 7 EF-2015]